MAVEVIDTLKPKNNGTFPVVEAEDVAVSDELRLPEALNQKAEQTDLEELSSALDEKADQSDLDALTIVVNGKADTSDVTTATANLQAQIDELITPVTQDAEVQNARVGTDGTSYQTLKARLDAENAKAFQFRGELSDLSYTYIKDAINIGCYNSRSATTAALSDKPDGVTGPFSLLVNKWSDSANLGTVQVLISSSGQLFQRFISAAGTIVVDWASITESTSQFRGELGALGYTRISQARKIGCYSSLSTSTENLLDMPAGVTGAFSLLVNTWLSSGQQAAVQLLITSAGDVWQRFLDASGNVSVDWASSAPTIAEHTSAINALNSVVYKQVSITIGLTAGKFWDVSGETAELKEHSDWSASAEIPVSEGEVYTVYADQGFSHKTRIWTLCDDELNILAKSEDIFYDRMEEDTFTVVSGATKLIISSKTHLPDLPSLKRNINSFDLINEEIIEIQSEIDSIKNEGGTKIPFSLEVGGYTAGGQKDDNTTTRARTKYFIPCNLLIGTIHFPEGVKHRIAYYNADDYASCYGLSEWSTSTEDTLTFPAGQTTATFNILVGYTDDREITTDNIPEVCFYYVPEENNKITGLTGYYLSSLVPAVGANANYILSPIIPVLSGEDYKATKFRNTLLLDEDLAPVRFLETSQITDNTITVGTTEKYICWCWQAGDCSEMYFAEKDKYIAGATIEDLVPLPLIGKKLSLLGDSISAYTGTIPVGNDVYYTGSNSGVTSPEQMWWSVLCSKTGMQPLVINGWSGSGITQLTDSAHVSKVPMSDTSRDQALHSGTTAPDVVLIAGGVNDYSYAQQTSQIPSSWEGKTAPVKGNSFTETYACMIKEIQEAYPSAIVVCLSTWFTMRGTDNGFTLLNGEGYTQADYDAEIEKVARIMRVPYINVEKCGFSRSNFYPTFAEDSSTIPTHPNARGQRVMGEYLADILPQFVHSFTSNTPEPEE